MADLDKPVLVFGSAALDVKARATEALARGGSVPGQVRVSVGGVARNIAECLARLEVPTVLYTAVGDDPLGDYVLSLTARVGVDVSGALRVPQARTAAFLAMLDEGGGREWSLDDMATLGHLTPEFVLRQRAAIQGARTVVLDNNLPPATVGTLIRLCREAGVSLCADPTSRFLAPRLAPYLSFFNLITPNQQEAAILCDCDVGDVDAARRAAQHLVRTGVKLALITMGDMGVVYATVNERGHLSAPEVDVVDATGASDAMTATVVYALINDIPVDEAIRLALTAATLTLTTQDTVREDLSLELLYEAMVV